MAQAGVGEDGFLFAVEVCLLELLVHPEHAVVLDSVRGNTCSSAWVLSDEDLDRSDRGSRRQCVFACSSERRTAKTLNQCKLSEPFHSSCLELRRIHTRIIRSRLPNRCVPSGRIGGGSRCRQEDARPTISAYLLHGINGGKLLGDPRGIFTAQRNAVC